MDYLTFKQHLANLLPNDITQGIAIGNLSILFIGGIIRDEIGDLERYLALALITWLGVICFI